MVINEKVSKPKKFVEVLFARTAFVGPVFVVSLISSPIIAESLIILAKCLPFSQYDLFCTNYVLSNFYIYISNLYFLPLNSHLHSHDMCFVNVFHSFIPVIIIKTCRFKSYILFRTNTLLKRLLKILKLSTHLSKLITNG